MTKPTRTKKVELLEHLKSNDKGGFEPELTEEEDMGYRYPEANQVIGESSKDTIVMLDELTRGGFLNRHLVECIHLCPDCSRYTLNFREVCPECKKVNITLTDMIHHYSCSFVGAETKYKSVGTLECPKCDEELTHIGVDYEKVNTIYICESCDHNFEEPNISCKCLSCTVEYDISRVEERKIFRYELSPQGEQAAKERSLDVKHTGAQLFNEKFGVYSLEMFEEQMEIEFYRSKRYERPLTLLLAQPSSGNGGVTSGNDDKIRGTNWTGKRLANIFESEIRRADFFAAMEDYQFAFLLSDTDIEGALVLARRLKQAVESQEDLETVEKSKLYIGMSGIEGRENPEMFLEQARKRLDRSKNRDEPDIQYPETHGSTPQETK